MESTNAVNQDNLSCKTTEMQHIESERKLIFCKTVELFDKTEEIFRKLFDNNCDYKSIIEVGLALRAGPIFFGCRVGRKLRRYLFRGSCDKWR